MLRAIEIAICVFAAPLVAAVEEKAVIERAFTVSDPQAARIEVENVWGDIRVTGNSGREVKILARETVSAPTKERIADARRDVKLDISQSGDTVRLYVDGPFRCNCRDGNSGWRGGRDTSYTVTYDFEIQAPAGASVFLRTVNDGEIKVSGISGDYDINNVNGGVEVLEAAGSGRVYALNGGVKVTFRGNPKAESYYGSLNGPVDLYFQPDLSADLRMKTFNGEIYSDFPVTALPRRLAKAERREGRTVYKSDRWTNARVGSGGPEIQLDGFNGDIRILKRER
jgi:hypothetical protein